MGHGSRGGSLKERERDGGEIEGGGQGEGEGEREKKKGRTRERGRGGNITAGCHSLSWVLILPEWESTAFAMISTTHVGSRFWLQFASTREPCDSLAVRCQGIE